MPISLLGSLSDGKLRVKPFDLGIDRQQHLQLGLGELRQSVGVVGDVINFDVWHFFPLPLIIKPPRHKAALN